MSLVSQASIRVYLHSVVVLLFLFFFIVPLMSISTLFAQNRGTTTLSFIEIPAGSRAISMGEAFVAVADDHSSLYWNPAGITQVQGE